MVLDVIPYLSRNKGLYLSHIGLNLKLVDSMYRFDSNRFDILAYDYEYEKFCGIKDLRTDVALKGLQKIVEDAKWLGRFKGNALVLIPAADKRLYGAFDDMQELIITKYYVADGKDYRFMDDLKEYGELKREKTKDTASRIITSPQVIDFFLKQFEKKSPAIKFARAAFSAYTKTRK